MRQGEGQVSLLGGLGTKNKQERTIFTLLGANCSKRNQESLIVAREPASQQRGLAQAGALSWVRDRLPRTVLPRACLPGRPDAKGTPLTPTFIPQTVCRLGRTLPRCCSVSRVAPGRFSPAPDSLPPAQQIGTSVQRDTTAPPPPSASTWRAPTPVGARRPGTPTPPAPAGPARVRPCLGT